MNHLQKYCNKKIFSQLNCCLLFKLVIIDSSCNLCQFLYQLQLMLGLKRLNPDKHVFSSNEQISKSKMRKKLQLIVVKSNSTLFWKDM